jgi:hypothetical protein
VYEYFGISFFAPGAHKDLALTLAFRHERDLLVQGNRICWRALCERYSVDPHKEGSDVTLSLALVDKYVAGERRRSEPQSDDWGTRFTTAELAFLTIVVAYVREHLLNIGEDASVRAIAKCLRDRQHLAEIISAKTAQSVQAMLLRRGNKSQGASKPLGDRRLRQIISDVQGLGSVLKSGRNLTLVQMQLYMGVVPLLASQRAGQN